MNFRTESDSIGTLQVPKDAYYGVQTLRARKNFFITGYRLNTTFISALAYVKKAAAICNLEAQTLDEDVANAIIQAADEVIAGKFKDEFITDVIQGGAGTSMNMNINEVLANRGNELLGGELGVYDKVHPNDHCNFGQSTNDVVPTSGKLTIQLLLQDLIKNLNELYDTLQEKGKKYDHIIKMGRTHLQDAVPIRVGQEFRAFAAPLQRDIKRLREAMDELSYVNMGATAVGTGLNADVNYVQRVVEVLSEVSGVQFKQCEDLVDGTRNLDSFVFLSSILKTCAVNLSKTANDIRLMSSGPKAGIAELILPQEQPGSSIMPGKVNPVIPEVVNQVCFQVFGNDVTITKAAEAGQLELNVFEPVLFFNLFQSIQILTNGVRTFIDNCIADISVNEEDCKYWLTRSVGIVTALTPHIGYKASSDLAKLSLQTGKPIYDLVLEQNLLDKEKLDIILNPFEMTKPGIAGKDLLKKEKKK